MKWKKLEFRDILLIIQTVLLAVLIVEVTILLNDTEKTARPHKRRSSNPKKVSVNMDELTKNSSFLGKKEAPVTLVEFNSFSCGYCKKARDPLMKLAKKYPDKLRIVYKHFNRGGIDYNTSQAVECAGEQGKFWEMYNTIFDKGSRGDMTRYAGDIGLDTGKFSQCISSGKYKEKTMKDTMDGRKLGVRGTPSFLLNDMLIPGYKPYNVLEDMVKKELE